MNVSQKAYYDGMFKDIVWVSKMTLEIYFGRYKYINNDSHTYFGQDRIISAVSAILCYNKNVTL